MDLTEISKAEFLDNFKAEFIGNDQVGYDYIGCFIEESTLAAATGHLASTLDEVDDILASENDDDGGDAFTELNNAIMAYIFGNGDEFQGSFEEETGSGDYDWYLDFGDIKVDRSQGGIFYSGVRFYRG